MNCYKRQIPTALSFGLGLLIASILPCEWVLVVASITIVLLGLSVNRR